MLCFESVPAALFALALQGCELLLHSVTHNLNACNIKALTIAAEHQPTDERPICCYHVSAVLELCKL